MGCGASDLSESEQAILRLGELVHKADVAAEKSPGSGHAFLADAASHLPLIDDDERDNYAILVKSRHGKMYYQEKDYSRAIDAYTQAINMAEVKIAERCRGLYLMLQRYAECMTDIATIWIGSANGEVTAPENSPANPSPLVPNAPSAIAQSAKRKRRDEATAEIVLLRCIETIEEGHNRRSDLLIDPLMQLASLYESLGLYSRAELLVRRCIGILIVQYGHDHPRLVESNANLERLVKLKESAAEEVAAVNIQKTFRMHRAMNELEKKLHRQVKRHARLEENRTPTPPTDFLSQLVGDDPEQSTGQNSPIDDHAAARANTGSRPGSFHGVAPGAAAGSPKRTTSEIRRNPVEAASQPKPQRQTTETSIQEQAAPKVWAVAGAEGEDIDEDDV